MFCIMIILFRFSKTLMLRMPLKYVKICSSCFSSKSKASSSLKLWKECPSTQRSCDRSISKLTINTNNKNIPILLINNMCLIPFFQEKSQNVFSNNYNYIMRIEKTLNWMKTRGKKPKKEYRHNQQMGSSRHPHVGFIVEQEARVVEPFFQQFVIYFY